MPPSSWPIVHTWASSHSLLTPIVVSPVTWGTPLRRRTPGHGSSMWCFVIVGLMQLPCHDLQLLCTLCVAQALTTAEWERTYVQHPWALGWRKQVGTKGSLGPAGQLGQPSAATFNTNFVHTGWLCLMAV